MATYSSILAWELPRTEELLSRFVSDSARPHRRQPTRLPHLWDSPGKNTGVGFHFLPQCMRVKSEREVAQSYPTLSDPMDCSLQGSSIIGFFQARVLEWGAYYFKKKKKASHQTKQGFYQKMCSELCDRHLWLADSTVIHQSFLSFFPLSIVEGEKTKYLLSVFLLAGGHHVTWFKPVISKHKSIGSSVNSSAS